MQATRGAKTALAALILLACSCRPNSSDEAPLGADCSAMALDDASRTAAMLSVHANAYWALAKADRFVDVIPDIRLCRLADAVALLARDEGPGALSRRRRAIAKLVAYSWASPRFEGAVTALRGNLTGIRNALKARYQGKAAVFRRLVRDPMLLEFELVNLLGTEPGLMSASAVEQGKCTWAEVEHPVSVDTGTTLSLVAHISVSISRDAVAKNIDPQSWDRCSKFWPPGETYLVDVDDVNDDCRIDATGCGAAADEFKPLPTVTPGTPYTGFLFERFVCKTSGCLTDFRNILTVTTGPIEIAPFAPSTATEVEAFRIKYSLPGCRTSGFDGFLCGKIDKRDAAVLVDQGRVTTWEQDGRTHVKSRKKVEFANPVDNATASVVLGFAELNEELAEVACCMDDRTSPNP